MVSIYPTGTTLFEPDKCWSGYTLLAGANMVDMNGRLRNSWDGIRGLHAKSLPDGHVLGASDGDYRRLVQLDWDENLIWEFDGSDYEEELRPHHDFQRQGNPTGYYVPDMMPLISGRTLILCRTNVAGTNIVAGEIWDDRIIEIDEYGGISWQWRSIDHVEEIGLSEAAKSTMYRASVLPTDYDGLHSAMLLRDPFDWLHSNSASYVGPNHWYDDGDLRFHPENIIFDSRNTNIIAIISRTTGEFTWKLGPDYSRPECKQFGQIIGQHHAHIIPRGLPGEGNLLVFDNGGYAGYGEPNPSAPIGEYNAVRPYSRVLEIGPATLDLKWEYSAQTLGYGFHHHVVFYSPYVSSAQRLPNGNTLICEGDCRRIIEVTHDYEIVWEYVVPPKIGNDVSYRAYRVPYDWVPQLERYPDTPVVPPDISEFHIDGQ